MLDTENLCSAIILTRRPASTDRTACRQFQAVFPVITGSFPTNIIAHLPHLSMDLTVGWTVGATANSTVGLTVKLVWQSIQLLIQLWKSLAN